jgi:hypothetical protein
MLLSGRALPVDELDRVLGAQYEGAYRPQHTVNIKRLIKPLSSLDEREDCDGAAADDYKIERIT